MSLNRIQALLDTKLQQICDDQGYEVFFENMPIESNTNYIAPFILPATNEGVGYGRSSDDLIGIYQINIMALKGKGSFWYRQVSDRIISGMRRGTKIESVVIESSYVSASLVYDDTYTLVPITINYRAFFGGIDNPYIPPSGGLNIWSEPNIWG